MSLGSGGIAPVDLALEKHRPSAGDRDFGAAIGRTGFEEQNTTVRLLGEAVCQYAARRTSADDYEIIRCHGRTPCTLSPAICTPPNAPPQPPRPNRVVSHSFRTARGPWSGWRWLLDVIAPPSCACLFLELL